MLLLMSIISLCSLIVPLVILADRLTAQFQPGFNNHLYPCFLKTSVVGVTRLRSHSTRIELRGQENSGECGHSEPMRTPRMCPVPYGTDEAAWELLRRSIASEPLLSECSEPRTIKRISVLGSTGSVGTQALDVVRSFPEIFRVSAIAAAGSDPRKIVEQVLEFRPDLVAVCDEKRAEVVRNLLTDQFYRRGCNAIHIGNKNRTGRRECAENAIPPVVSGPDGVEQAACETSDIVVSSIVGVAGLKPTLSALYRGIDVALANKEALVAAGPLFQQMYSSESATLNDTSSSTAATPRTATIPLRFRGTQYAPELSRRGRRFGWVLPIDSEHSAIMQALQGAPPSACPPSRIILCASGGPFCGLLPRQLAHVKLEDALKHPKWRMGKKITVDSATLMNKGLEVIEAHEAFGVEYENIDVHVHPQAIMHSAVEFQDGSVIAQLGLPDMKLPIAYALSWPHRLKLPLPRLNLFSAGPLTFAPPDTYVGGPSSVSLRLYLRICTWLHGLYSLYSRMNKPFAYESNYRKTFGCLALAYAAGKRGGLYPAVLNAANEEAVRRFTNREIHFIEIEQCIAGVLDKAGGLLHSDTSTKYTVEDVVEADRWAREQAGAFQHDSKLAL